MLLAKYYVMTFALSLNPSPKIERGTLNPAPLLPFWEQGLGEEG